jgi:hypothetical protein
MRRPIEQMDGPSRWRIWHRHPCVCARLLPLSLLEALILANCDAPLPYCLHLPTAPRMDARERYYTVPTECP